MFESDFADLFILTLSSHGMQNGEEALLSIILVGGCILVKMLITVETHHLILHSYTNLNIIKTLLVCMTVARLCQG